MIEVVIPAYQAAPFLRETLLSVAAQSMPPGQVTVVDDRSTDGTRQIAEACAEELRDRIKIQVIDNIGPRGPSAARNTAIRASSATHIALLDADDLLEPLHHATLLGLLNAAPGAILSFGDNTVFQDETTLVESNLAASGVAALPADEVAPDCFTLGDAMFNELLRTSVFGTSTCLFDREAALAVGLFDESMMFSEDMDFFLRMTFAGRFMFTRQSVTRKRVHGSNLSQASNALRFCQGAAHALTKLATRSPNPPEGPQLTLSAVQRLSVNHSLPKALAGYLYHASRAGLKEYWKATILARRSGNTTRAAHPRHLLRLALQRLF